MYMEQWKELKETIMELSKFPQMVNQTELCMFLLAYMEVLEDRMRDDIDISSSFYDLSEQEK